MERRKSKQILCGRIKIGGDAPITVQTMLNFPPQKVEENVRAAQRMEQAGCDILRIAVPDEAGVALVRALKEAVRMPIVADIHFDYRLAIAAVEAGCDKVRINPGNIGGEDRVRQVAECCRSHGVPIRIGVNGGSLIFCKNMARPRPLRCARARCGMLRCWNSLISRTLCCRSSLPTCPRCWKRIG